MAKKKRKAARSKSTPRGIKALAWILCIALIAGVAGVKYFKSSRGQLFLLGTGFSGYYATAQERVDEALREALFTLNLTDALEVTGDQIAIGGERFSRIVWKLSCGEEYDLVQVNLAFTRAARSCGGAVLDSREDGDGRELRLEIGRGRYSTHRIVIRKTDRSGRGEAGPDGGAPKLAIVIDDFGYSRNGVVAEFLHLDMPITCSIIPTLPYSESLAERARAAGKEVILHLPMEPEEERRYDVMPVTTAMSAAEIETMVEGYLAALTGVVGVNNHMGSKATQDERVMHAVLSVLKRHRLFFLDSLTSPRSIAYNAAIQMGIKTARNDLFIDDNTREPERVMERIERLIERAKRNGTAVGIGHPHRWTLDAISRMEPSLARSGVRMVFLSELVR